MSTQKNEHNPDKLRPETVGEGWRLLTKGEVQEIGDEWWYGGEWCPVHRDNVGRHYEFTTTRRRITPPTETTGSGREGETPETDAEIDALETLDRNAAWVGLKRFARQLERQRDAALDALRHFMYCMKRYGNWDDGCFYYNSTSASELVTPMEEASAAINSAQRQEGK